MRKSGILALAIGMACAPVVHAFCGFYVAKADAKLFNKASQVVLVRDADRTVLTMANDYKGDPREFAIVVPVPTFIEEGQIHVGDKAVIDHLDAYSAPRLVEYFDEDPCNLVLLERAAKAAAPTSVAGRRDERDKALGVTIEAQYTVGEYDIVILSAEQSTGLETWLKENDYRIPEGAAGVLESYIRQSMHFFVARVDLEEQAKLGFSYLRPLQVAYESPKFMLPIRLGTLNADGPQDLLIYALTRNGRVETTNYRTIRLPTGMDIPVYVKGEFADFYRAMFDEQVKRENMTAVFLEYAWDMNWCDPCAADPLSDEELRQLGVFWQVQELEPQGVFSPNNPNKSIILPQARNVFVTRLHVRYTAEKFPEDLVLQETADRESFQGRYVLRHAWDGKSSCAAAEQYRHNLTQRRDQEAQTLSNLTGWDVNSIRSKMGLNVIAPKTSAEKWWEKLWTD
ncbi:MAG: DUF2330 domain-containing protein [Chromatiales bacterium]